MGESFIPVLLDTDIGTDVDDAIALSYLLRQPRCQVIGISTVSGQPDKRASIADAVCRAAGRHDIPIHVGIEAPLSIPQKQPLAQHFEVLPQPLERKFDKINTAIDFMRATIHNRPGEVVLLSIGPMTNIATLFREDPEVPKLLRRLVVMGGEYFNTDPNAKSEWNIKCDPHAAHFALSSPVEILLVGLDVTLKCVLKGSDCLEKFAAAGESMKLVHAMAQNWSGHTGIVTFHDPLAAALIFDPTLCETAQFAVRINPDDPVDAGMTRATPSAGSNLTVATAVNPKAFFDHFFGVLNTR